MATILETTKELLEVDVEEEIFDNQLLLYVNAGMRYLVNNKIPVGVVKTDTTFDDFKNLKAGDEHIVISWLHLYAMQRFDRTLMTTNSIATATKSWIDTEMQDLITQLKAIYDNSSSNLTAGEGTT